MFIQREYQGERKDYLLSFVYYRTLQYRTIQNTLYMTFIIYYGGKFDSLHLVVISLIRKLSYVCN